jgi:hypothetical protein
LAAFAASASAAFWLALVLQMLLLPLLLATAARYVLELVPLVQGW